MSRTFKVMERELGQRSRTVLVLVATAIACVVGVLVVDREPSQVDVQTTADATAEELERTPVRGLGIDIFDVRDAMGRATRGTGDRFHPDMVSRLRVRSAGENSDGDLYEITTSHGHYAVCLAVAGDEYPDHVDDFEDLTDIKGLKGLEDGDPSFPTTEVTYAPCHPG